MNQKTPEEVVKQDSRETKNILSENSVDVAITSPPYADLKDYNAEDQIGYGQEYDEYMSDIKTVFEGVHSSLKEDGSLWLVVDTYKRNKDVKMLPFEMAEQLKEIGFKLREIIIWDKNRTLPWTNEGEMRNVYEYILVFSKSDQMKFNIDRIKDPEDLKHYWRDYPERYNPKGKTPSNIWSFDIPQQGSWGDDTVKHACPFPPGLVERIIHLASSEGDTVLDPFAGTGTVVAQAECMNRQGIGFELNEEYIDNYYNKIKPKIKEEWKKGKSEAEKAGLRRDELKDAIYKLRQLKFPKTVVRRLINDKGWNEEELHLNSIFAMPKEGTPEEKHKIMFEKVVILHDNGLKEEELKQDIIEVSENPPASKFGIKPKIEIKHMSEVNGDVEEYFEDEKMYLYTKGKFNDFVRTMDYETWKDSSKREKWKKNFRNGVPPILSPLRADMEELKKKF